MTTSILDDESAHVKELNRLFLSCAKNGDAHLDASGIRDLCVKLNLSPFIDVILERILSGYTIVDFAIFKDRFVQLLPDIISFTAAAENLEAKAEKVLSDLGIEPEGFLTRYETRILCKQISELNSLGLVGIDQLFDKADTTHEGRITLAQLLSQYEIQKQLSEEVDFITETFIPTVNLFEALDPSNTGNIRCQELLEYWRACGINIEQGLYVLKLSGQPLEGTVNALLLSSCLERHLGDLAAAPTASTIIRVALLSLHAFIDHLRCSIKEAELRAEHFHKQFQQANQRHVLLIEEFEQNQISMEQTYEQRFRDSDERYRAKIAQIEERFNQEKKDLLIELEKAENELAHFRKTESSYCTRLQLLENQFARVTENAQQLSNTVQKLEQMNKHLCNEIARVSEPKPLKETQATTVLKHRVELLAARNKRLREQIDDLRNNGKRRISHLKTFEPLYFHWTNTFRSEILALKRRREGRSVDSPSEIESEPESIFIKSRKRRLLKIKERKRRYELITKILVNSSSNERIVNTKENEEKAQSVGSNKKFKHSLVENLHNNVLEPIREQHRKEIAALKNSANKTLAKALNRQLQITQNFEKEKHQFQLKLMTEKYALERNFTKEKMKMIDRLKEEFKCELTRLKTVMSPSTSVDSKLSTRENFGATKVSASWRRDQANSSFNFKNLLNNEPYRFNVFKNFRRYDDAYKMFDLNKNNGALNIEKVSQPYTPFKAISKNVNMTHDQCSHYQIITTKLKQIYAAVGGDGNIGESGFEDFLSSADSITEVTFHIFFRVNSISAHFTRDYNNLQEKAYLKNEIKKLGDRLYSVREKIIDLHTYLTLRSSQCNMTRCSTGCIEKFENHCMGRPFDDYIITGNNHMCRQGFSSNHGITKIEQLKAENLLLNARLSQSSELVKMLLREYSDELDRTSRLGKFIRSIYSINEE
ncbi:unnamed protein product [Thelazia callipaeda]|uniref:EF-hand domain-containing protein n=1 Tax=Thelazia callipaeda TaxID=103827 RepID=A0A0N5CUP2_THECL|nr:unnamed protein product [Thelazia callipaeda]